MNEEKDIYEGLDEEDRLFSKDQDEREKYEEMQELYGDYVSYYCPKCKDNIRAMFIEDHDDKCPNCNTSKAYMPLVIEKEEYKKMMINDYEFGILRPEYYICPNCEEEFEYIDYVKNDFKCPKCNKAEERTFEYHCNNCEETFWSSEIENIKCPNCNSPLEEYEYLCENCYERFTSNDTENVECPHCHYVNEQPKEYDNEDFEPDYEPTEEEWEDIQLGDD